MRDRVRITYQKQNGQRGYRFTDRKTLNRAEREISGRGDKLIKVIPIR